MTWVSATLLALVITYWLVLGLCKAAASDDDDEQMRALADQRGWGDGDGL